MKELDELETGEAIAQLDSMKGSPIKFKPQKDEYAELEKRLEELSLQTDTSDKVKVKKQNREEEKVGAH